MQKKIDSGNKDPKFILSYIEKLSPLKTPNALLFEKYLEALPPDSLWTRSTLYRVSMNYHGSMPVNGLAARVLLNAYKDYSVKSMELMSPWCTLRYRLLDEVEQAGAQRNRARLDELVEANNRLEDVPLAADRERDYLYCIYYFHSRDTAAFITQANKYATRYILKADTFFLNNLDRQLLAAAKEYKFGSRAKNTWSYSDITESQFEKTFYSETERTHNELIDIISLYERMVGGKDASASLPTEHWREAGKSLFGTSGL
jgi:hypothetical protein